MRTVLLTSSGSFVTDSGIKLLGKTLPELALTYITTAAKGVADKSYMERRRQRMRELAFNFHEFDIEDKKENEIKEELVNKEAVYIEGGNTFYLLKHIRESGFGAVIRKFVLQGKLIYIGSSAGAYVACPTVEMAAWKHQDKYDHCGITDFSGLSLVPFLVTVHYIPSYKEVIQDHINHSAHQLRILTDEQALLVQDNKITLLGSQDEVKL